MEHVYKNNVGYIEIEETKKMLVDITGATKITEDDCKAFVKELIKISNEELKNTDSVARLSLKKEELVLAIEGGLDMKAEERVEFAKQGRLEKILMDFFNALEQNLEKRREDMFGGGTDFLDFIWNKYDADGSGFIEEEETKKMIQEVTGNTEQIEHENFNRFVSSISMDDDTISKEELIKFSADFSRNPSKGSNFALSSKKIWESDFKYLIFCFDSLHKEKSQV